MKPIRFAIAAIVISLLSIPSVQAQVLEPPLIGWNDIQLELDTTENDCIAQFGPSQVQIALCLDSGWGGIHARLSTMIDQVNALIGQCQQISGCGPESLEEWVSNAEDWLIDLEAILQSIEWPDD